MLDLDNNESAITIIYCCVVIYQILHNWLNLSIERDLKYEITQSCGKLRALIDSYQPMMNPEHCQSSSNFQLLDKISVISRLICYNCSAACTYLKVHFCNILSESFLRCCEWSESEATNFFIEITRHGRHVTAELVADQNATFSRNAETMRLLLSSFVA